MTNKGFARSSGFVRAAILADTIIFTATPGQAHGGFDAWEELGADGRMAHAQNGAQAYAPMESAATHSDLANEMLVCMGAQRNWGMSTKLRLTSCMRRRLCRALAAPSNPALI